MPTTGALYQVESIRSLILLSWPTVEDNTVVYQQSKVQLIILPLSMTDVHDHLSHFVVFLIKSPRTRGRYRLTTEGGFSDEKERRRTSTSEVHVTFGELLFSSFFHDKFPTLLVVLLPFIPDCGSLILDDQQMTRNICRLNEQLCSHSQNYPTLTAYRWRGPCSYSLPR